LLGCTVRMIMCIGLVFITKPSATHSAPGVEQGSSAHDLYA
jgi:hypothetical protein